MSERALDSRSNATVRRIKDIRDGLDKHFLFCEGFNVAEDLLLSGLDVIDAYGTTETKSQIQKLIKKSQRAIPLTILSPQVMDYVSDLSSPPGVILLARRPAIGPSRPLSSYNKPLLLVLHELQLPQNVGGLLRTSEAAGVSEVWLTTRTADAFGPKALRGASGSAFRQTLRQGVKLESGISELKAAGVRVVAATQHGDVPYDEFNWTQSAALVLGSEGGGFSKDVLKLFETQVRIPMAGKIESLNAATAAAVCLFEAARQRRTRVKTKTV